MVGRLCPTRPDQPAVCVLGRGVEIRTSVVVERYFAAEHRLDPDEAAACFTDDAVLVEPNGRRHVGRLAIKVFYETLYAGIDQLDVWVVDEVTAGARAAIEWQADVADQNGATRLRGVNIVAVRDGHFSEAHVYFTAVG